MLLDWPYEGAAKLERIDASNAGNLCIPGNTVVDAHGDPMKAQLIIFSDGNHHMGLETACQLFLKRHPTVQDIFYTTAPAGTIKDAFSSGVLRFGNLCLSIKPNVFIGPQKVVGPLHAAGQISKPIPFAQSRGVVLLVKKGNPKQLSSKISDLLRDDVRIACSSPTKEKASFGVYCTTLCNLASVEGGQNMSDAMNIRLITSPVHSSRIHHREIPQLIANDEADVAPLYYHLALRYVTIFPNLFEFIPLGGTKDDPQPGKEHKLNTYLISVVKENEGEWGSKFADFMLSQDVADIYKKKGLTPVVVST